MEYGNCEECLVALTQPAPTLCMEASPLTRPRHGLCRNQYTKMLCVTSPCLDALCINPGMNVFYSMLCVWHQLSQYI